MPEALFEGTLDDFWKDVQKLDAEFEEETQGDGRKRPEMEIPGQP